MPERAFMAMGVALKEDGSRRDAVARYTALLRASDVLCRHRSIEELFSVLATELHPVVPFDYLALILHDAKMDEMRLVVLEPRRGSSAPDIRMPVSAGGPAALVWQHQKPSVIPIPAEGPVAPTLDLIRRSGQKVTAWLPLTTTHSRLGVLSFGSTRSTDYAPDTLPFMEQVAAQVTIAIENGLNFDRARNSASDLSMERDRLRLILEINNLLVTKLEGVALLKEVSNALQQYAEHDQLAILAEHRAEDGRALIMLYDTLTKLTRRGRFHVADLLERAMKSGTTSVLSGSAFVSASLEALRTPFMRLCCVPLATRRGVVGALILTSNSEEAFGPAATAFLGQVSVQIALAVDNALAYEGLAAQRQRVVNEKAYLEEEVRLQRVFGELVGKSRALNGAVRLARSVAPTDSTVLLLGETGTGKELMARAIHDMSPRSRRTFVRVSGAALPVALLESELFGHEKGAFTGATTKRIGRVEIAHRGTLFLDEVGDVPPEIQAKLLRVLQEREFEPLGSNRTRRVDVRVIAATNRNLEQMVEDGGFRSDLFYRLNVFPITLPPLRNRREDIKDLTYFFVRMFADRMRRSVPTVPDRTLRALTEWTWPGNVRELQNVVERAMILSDSTLQIAPEVLASTPGTRERRPRHLTIKEAERQAILDALQQADGIISGPSGAAARLGLKRTTLQSMMRRLGIRKPTY